jgi:Tol biopolymer transport system component
LQASREYDDPGFLPGQNETILFTSSRDGNGEIYVMNADGTGQTNITNNPAFDSVPDWQPAGVSCFDNQPPALIVVLTPSVLS